VPEEINSQGGEAISIHHDVSTETQWSRIISETLERFRKLDVLVNNAGVMVWKMIADNSLSGESKFITGAELVIDGPGQRFNGV
jgi:NADP-dependent 3-hydroxy acid dehydrogenase YdfG